MTTLNSLHIDIAKVLMQCAKENKTITLRTVEDKTLIGGVKVQIENRVYDGSLKNKVSKLKTELLRK